MLYGSNQISQHNKQTVRLKQMDKDKETNEPKTHQQIQERNREKTTITKAANKQILQRNRQKLSDKNKQTKTTKKQRKNATKKTDMKNKQTKMYVRAYPCPRLPFSRALIMSSRFLKIALPLKFQRLSTISVLILKFDKEVSAGATLNALSFYSPNQIKRFSCLLGP